MNTSINKSSYLTSLDNGIPSGFEGIDKIIGSFKEGELVIVGARPLIGKTSFLISLAIKIGIEFKTPVGYFSLETSSANLIYRFISSETNIPYDKLLRGKLNDYEEQKLYSNIQSLKDSPIIFDENIPDSLDELKIRCIKLFRTKDVKIFLLDNINILKNNFGDISYSEIFRYLKSICLELNITIIVSNNIANACEVRINKRPNLTDIYEYPEVEEMTDIIFLIHRPEYYKIAVWDNDEEGQESSTENQAELIIAKHRNGATADVRLSFMKHFAKFGDIGETDSSYPSGGSKSHEPSGFEKIKTTIQPGAAFDLPDNSKVSGSSMNDLDDEDDFPF
jgi:replicative DNA helicase